MFWIRNAKLPFRGFFILRFFRLSFLVSRFSCLIVREECGKIMPLLRSFCCFWVFCYYNNFTPSGFSVSRSLTNSTTSGFVPIRSSQNSVKMLCMNRDEAATSRSCENNFDFVSFGFCPKLFFFEPLRGSDLSPLTFFVFRLTSYVFRLTFF